MRIGLVGGSYTARSSAVADEETINLMVETIESQGAIVPAQAYGGKTAANLKALFGTPGLSVFANLGSVPRGTINANGRLLVVAGSSLIELSSAAAQTNWGTIVNDGNPASLAFNGIQVLIVSAGQAYCFTLATNALLNVTGQLAAAPLKAEEADSYFIVSFSNSNKFQISQVLDGTTWPGLLVNIPSVFPENVRSILVNHRELWVFGTRHIQPYENTGSAEVYDVIPGALIENGISSTFNPCRLDNSIFWVGEDERGARIAWRSNGYTPSRISTHAVETDFGTYSVAQIAGMVTYAYQDGGHLFWVIYIPGSQWSWTYDVGEGLWHKRQSGIPPNGVSHYSWNHVYIFGLHLVGDWNSGNLYSLSMSNLQDNGNNIRRIRRTPTVIDEMRWIYWDKLIVDFDTGQGPQPPLLDGAGNPRQPQAMLQWSDNRGKTWSNEHWADCGFAGQFTARAIWRKMGRSRYRVVQLILDDPIPWVIFDGYLNPPE